MDAAVHTAIGFDKSAAFGPTILIKPLTLDALRQFRDLILEIARSQTSVDLAETPGFGGRDIDSLVIEYSDDEDGGGLSQVGAGPSFNWHGSATYWHHVVGLLEPLCDGQTGHQYLTDADDPAIVVLSFGEPEVGRRTYGLDPR